MNGKISVIMCWENGVSLRQARFRFGPRKLVDRYAEVQRTQPGIKMIEVFAEQFSVIAEPDKKTAKSILSDPSYQEASLLNQEQAGIQRQLENRLRGFLSRGQLVGVGYSLPRAPDTQPVQIPQDVWTGRIKWEKDEVDGNGLKFVAVRVIRPETVDDALQIQTITPNMTKGRPTRREQIEAAFWALDREGRVPDFPENKKSLFDPIIEKIDELFPAEVGDRTGLSDKTLYSTLSKLLDAKSLKRNE